MKREYLDKTMEYMTHLVPRGHGPQKVKSTFTRIRKITRSEARREKERTVNKNSIFFPAEYNPREPSVKAVIKRYEHILQNNKTLAELFPQNSIVAANKRAKYLHQLILRTDPYNIKINLLNQAQHGYSKCGRKCDLCYNFILEKISFICHATKVKFKIRRDSTCTSKNIIYLAHYETRCMFLY